MRYSKQQKTTSRNSILVSALKLFAHRGFDNVSIDEVMADAGLTRGAFYAHFKNKQELYSQAILSASNRERQELPAQADKITLLKQLVSEYLDANYSDPDVLPCPLAYLVTDVANRDPEIRSVYAESYAALNRKIKNLLSANATVVDTNMIYALTSMMIGSVAIARTITDTASRNKLIRACKKTAFTLIDDA